MSTYIDPSNKKEITMYDMIASRYDQFISDLETIVNIDSGSHYIEGLNQVTGFFQERFDRIGWKTTRHAFDDGKVPCLEVSNRPLDGDDATIDLLFIGHMDTVFKAGTAASRPFSTWVSAGTTKTVASSSALR